LAINKLHADLSDKKVTKYYIWCYRYDINIEQQHKNLLYDLR
jgi:hypothetical protein